MEAQKPEDRGETDAADGQIDPEDPSPGHSLGECSTNDWPEDGAKSPDTALVAEVRACNWNVEEI